MENFFKNLKNKLSIENVMELVDDGKVIDDDAIKENIISEEIKTSSYMNYDEIQTELDNIKKINEPEEKKDEKDLKEPDSHRSNVAEVKKEQSKLREKKDEKDLKEPDSHRSNVAEVKKEQSKLREKKDLPIFF